MTAIQLTGCDAMRPDRRAIAQTIEDIATGVDSDLAREFTDILLAGSPVDLEIVDNESSAYRALRKLSIDYEIME